MTMKHAGLGGIRRAVADNITLARALADRIRETPELEIAAPSDLSVVCFRHRGSDDLNRALLERLQLAGEAFLTSTELDGRFVLRACIVNARSTRADVDRVVDAIVRMGLPPPLERGDDFGRRQSELRRQPGRHQDDLELAPVGSGPPARGSRRGSTTRPALSMVVRVAIQDHFRRD